MRRLLTAITVIAICINTITASQVDAVIDNIRSMASSDNSATIDTIEIEPDTLWAQIRVSVASLRSSGKYSAELTTQLLMGMPVMLQQEKNGWWYVQGPDGYTGWVHKSSLEQKTQEQMQKWRNSERMTVTTQHQTSAFNTPYPFDSRDVVTDLVPGCIVECISNDATNDYISVLLPDNRKCWVREDEVTPIQVWASQPFDAETILDQAYSMMGAPYLWGGTSTKATDCSGLVKISYHANGLMLRRDASQQIQTGVRIDPSDWQTYEAGDLVFFSDKPNGRASHVAIYDCDGNIIHCAGNVHVNSLNPESPGYINRVSLGATRIKDSIGTDGIIRIIDHPWYFDKIEK